jgi:hypothetical protein
MDKICIDLICEFSLQIYKIYEFVNFARLLKRRFLFWFFVCRLLGLILCKRVLERRSHVAEALAGAIPKKCPLQQVKGGKKIG